MGDSSSGQGLGLTSQQWLYTYKTSSTIIDGRPVDILHDFYIPVLKLATRYDRVAGYFRSTSLAAASQGFSAFVGKHGKMRLIVGADLEPHDVKAILSGDAQRLTAHLNGELESSEAWPEAVKNGVSLLAWMVAKGFLEVRVAFRVHGVSGEPLPFESVEDGYVHEKWFVLSDEYGNRLYGSGTLNESKTGLAINAENIDIHCDWWGAMDKLRVDNAAQDFDRLWEGHVPHMPVYTLPAAVKQRLIRYAENIQVPKEIDGTSEVPPQELKPSDLERLKFALIKDGPKLPNGRLVGMETAPVELWPHQQVVVTRLVETWPFSYLLCDEVGLGKTIEAGVAIRCLYLSGIARRILITAPASLTRQWHRQMATKVLLSFGRVVTAPDLAHEYVFPKDKTIPAQTPYEPDLVIMSTGLLSRKDRAEGLKNSTPFDIALVDEAHYARRRNPTGGTKDHPDYGNLYLSIREYLLQQTSSLWMATATPMQIDPVEVCDLLALINRVGAFQLDPTLTLEFYEVLGKLLARQELDNREWEFLRQTVIAVKKEDPLLWSFLESSVIDGRIRTAFRQWLEQGRVPRGRDRELMNRIIFSASPLARVMMRHTRPLLELYRQHGQLSQKLAQRHVSTKAVRFTTLEKRIYDQLEEYCEELGRQSLTSGDNERQMVSFLLSFLRLRFASSLYAIKETLTRRLRKVEATLQHQLRLEAEGSDSSKSALEDLVFETEHEDDLAAVETLLKDRATSDLEWERTRLQAMLNDMADITGPSSKMQELLKQLDLRFDRSTGRIKQTVIFSRFLDTVTDIVKRLRHVHPAMLIGIYSGQGASYYDLSQGRMVVTDRDDVKERFLRGEIDVLVCTDAAAEGLNLQTADLLLNFDLGWNPMKIEQRIGRIDRIGQKYDHIYVINLCYADSAEEIVYGRLLNRLADANAIVGAQQTSLLPIEPEDFQMFVNGEITEAELEARARERLALKQRTSARMEIPAHELYDIYRRLTDRQQRNPVPITLKAIWDGLTNSQYLKALGCKVTGQGEDGIFEVNGFDNISPKARLTISRRLYEEGLAGGGRVKFASYGEPLFDALLANIDEIELPTCVKRLAIKVPQLDGADVVAYGVVSRDINGSRTVLLITKWEDLQQLTLADGEALTEGELEELYQKLQSLIISEFAPCLAAKRIERDNKKAAYSQEILDYLTIYDILHTRSRATAGALFAPVIREIEAITDDRTHMRVSMPADVLREIDDELLFKSQVPAVGDRAQFEAPRVLLKASIDAASRIVDGMKVKKSELRVDTVLSRLYREADVKFAKIKSLP